MSDRQSIQPMTLMPNDDEPSAVILSRMAKNWWILFLRGIVAIGFGVLVFIWPGPTLLTLVLLFGAYAFVNGLLALVFGGARALMWWLAVIWLQGIVAWLLSFVWPDITALILLLFFAGWAIGIGIFEMNRAIRLRTEIQHEWLLMMCGIISVVFALSILLAPSLGALAVAWVIGFCAVLESILCIALAFRLKRHSWARRQ